MTYTKKQIKILGKQKRYSHLCGTFVTVRTPRGKLTLHFPQLLEDVKEQEIYTRAIKVLKNN